MTVTRFISSLFLAFIACGFLLFQYLSSQSDQLHKLSERNRVASDQLKLVKSLAEECSLFFEVLGTHATSTPSHPPGLIRVTQYTQNKLNELRKTDEYRDNAKLSLLSQSIGETTAIFEHATNTTSTTEEKEKSAEKIHDISNDMKNTLDQLIQKAETNYETSGKSLEQQQNISKRNTAFAATLYVIICCGFIYLAARTLVTPLQDIIHSAEKSISEGSHFEVKKKEIIEEHAVLISIIHKLIKNLEESVQNRTLELQKRSKELQEQVHLREDLETQLIHSQKLETIGQMASMITHEVNTPSQFIMDNLYFLKDIIPKLKTCSKEELDEITEKMEGCVGSGIDGIERVIEIVRSMKNFAHGGTDMMHNADINAALEDTIVISTGQWKYVANIERKFDQNLPIVRCMISELNQVFLNLIVNAAQAIEESGKDNKGTITVATRSLKEEEMVEISISDNGCGIPEEIRDKVFDKFFTTKKIGVGTGQGLAVSMMVIQNHHGKIRMESEEGAGTKFVIQIPLKQPAETDPEAHDQDMIG